MQLKATVTPFASPWARKSNLFWGTAASLTLFTLYLLRRIYTNRPRSDLTKSSRTRRASCSGMCRSIPMWAQSLFSFMSRHGDGCFARQSLSGREEGDEQEPRTPDRMRAGRCVMEAFLTESSRLQEEKLHLLGEICVTREALRKEDVLHQTLTAQLEQATDMEAVSSQNRDLLIDLLNERAELVRENVRLTREEQEVRQMLQFAEGFLDEGCGDSDTEETVVVGDDGLESPLWFLEESVASDQFRESVHHERSHALESIVIDHREEEGQDP